MSLEKITLSLGKSSYDIVLETGCLERAGELLSLNRNVLVVTDSGVPESYADTVAAASLAAEVVRIPQGESSKNFEHFHMILRRMLAFGMGRGDCVAAVGGGVVSDQVRPRPCGGMLSGRRRRGVCRRLGAVRDSFENTLPAVHYSWHKEGEEECLAKIFQACVS